MNRPARAGLSALALGLFALACGEPTAPISSSPSPSSVTPRLVILYATCALNRDYLSPYNPRVRYTPALEEFARDSVVFTKHRTEAGLSGVAYASILSGRQAPGHGIFTHPERISNAAQLATEVFAEGGYDVHVWSGHRMADAKLNYAQGAPKKNIHDEGLILRSRGSEDFRRILKRVAADPDYRAFVFTNFTVTHGPYDLSESRIGAFCEQFPSECAIRDEISREQWDRLFMLYRDHHLALEHDFAGARERLKLSDEDVRRLAAIVELVYKSNVHRLDGLFGELIDAIGRAGLWDETLVAFTADHGETLFDEDAPLKWSHSHTLRADVLDAPLLIRSPDETIARQSADFVTRSIDVLPTLAAWAGLRLPPEGGIEGVDLTPALRGAVPPPNLLAYSHTGMLPRGMDARPDREIGALRVLYPAADMAFTWAAVREGDRVFKLRRTERGEFRMAMFDLATDPRERRDLYDPAKAEHQAMAERLSRYRLSLIESSRRWETRRTKEPQIAPSEQLERLRSLGYLK